MAIDNDKPAIFIALPSKLNNKLPDNLEPMVNGIEEEQIPFQTMHVESSDSAVDRAYQAAVASRLSVGISFDDQQIVVHYKNLKPNEPLLWFLSTIRQISERLVPMLQDWSREYHLRNKDR